MPPMDAISSAIYLPVLLLEHPGFATITLGKLADIIVGRR